MERRFILAIGLMIGVVVLANLLFPPTPPPLDLEKPEVVEEAGGLVEEREPSGIVASPEADSGAGLREATPDTEGVAAIVEAPQEDAASQGEIVTVRSDLYEFRFDTRGARLVGATMLEHLNFAPPGFHTGENVEIIRAGDALLGYRVAAGADTVSLDSTVFRASATSLDVTSTVRELTFETQIGESELNFEVTYRFVPDDFRIEVSGGLRGLDRGHSVLVGLGRGVEMNEANEREDVAQVALVTRGRTGTVSSERLSRVDDGETRPVGGGPFGWVASKSKYWLAALVAPETGAGFGGVVLRGVAEENAAEMRVTIPVAADSEGFEYLAYVGPQDFERLRAVGQELHNVNPYGWHWLRWFIRPFGNLMETVLLWMHESFSLEYGWVLILFGVLSRVILFPLYQISMRQQMKQMAVQPEVKKIQERYKDDPPKLQKEMMKVYKEHGVNPLGGCLPMMLPMPILITLFFVFQNTIEFRGVPFMWITDLSLKDPLYIIPVLMGGSMLFLNWIGQRGMETNQQMKMFTYVLPVVFTFMFAQFAAGLNMYYTASNIASLPQQIYLSRERRRARPGGAVKPDDADEKKPTRASVGAKKPKRTRKKGPGGRG